MPQVEPQREPHIAPYRIPADPSIPYRSDKTRRQAQEQAARRPAWLPVRQALQAASAAPAALLRVVPWPAQLVPWPAQLVPWPAELVPWQAEFLAPSLEQRCKRREQTAWQNENLKTS